KEAIDADGRTFEYNIENSSQQNVAEEELDHLPLHGTRGLALHNYLSHGANRALQHHEIEDRYHPADEETPCHLPFPEREESEHAGYEQHSNRKIQPLVDSLDAVICRARHPACCPPR